MKVGIDYVTIYAGHCIVSDRWYVGQTTRTFEERKKEHITSSFNELRGDYNYLFHCAIRKYGEDSIEWFIIEDNIPVPYHFEGRKKISDYTAADEREIYWIADKNSYEQGYNMTRGGHDNSICTSIQIIQYDKNGSFIKQYNSIHEASRETGIKCSSISSCINNKWGYNSAGGYIWKLKITNDYPLTISAYENTKTYNKKIILQYTSDGIFVKQYKSIREASRETGINHGNISACAKGRYNSAGGYIWKYDFDKIDIITPYHYKRAKKTVYQYTKDGILVGEYESSHDAAENTGIHRSAIANCLIGKSKLAGGYRWKYKKDAC